MRQAAFVVARELAETWAPRFEETIAWPKDVAVLGTFPCVNGDTVVLIGGEDPTELPWDGVEVMPVFRSISGGHPVFCQFELITQPAPVQELRIRLEILAGDVFFEEGVPDEMCSRCLVGFAEGEQPIRIIPKDGREGEWRYHTRCLA